ncbi:sensor histidine kinase [Clostridium folliculivorans]|uniref:histidine kinase n=1 Tax=Clostridium folliculivorans TaxID=2886038 RepID=A0A9W6DAE5_9CLOT|nr:HAMP domain-containing sensor histidine kinase [Clostridium folliculivorans]GKU24588.1 two-component sensor histidine kinase [Clostridium folliculivorans]GKU30686.1 two-component sensor histidine kinase [Clostridium folliculivorans]
MKSIRRKLSIMFFICSLAAILLITVFVNLTITKKFDDYMVDTQNKRYERIVSYFQEIYKREGKWSKDSGIEMMHEAYMGNYCLTLLDSNEKTIWGMDANDIKNNLNFNTMMVKDTGVYTSKRFSIEVDNKKVGYVDIGQYSSVLLSEEDVNFKLSINKSIIASGFIAMIITIVISLYFSKQFSRPIKEVSKMSVSLSRGNFDTKSVTKSNMKELENLRTSVNVLAEKLKQQDMLRKRLVSDISHEIRTPLNILQNNLEAMIDGIFPITDDRLKDLNDEVIRFGKLLSNLELLKQFESESIKANFETVDVNQILKSICEDFYMEAQNQGIQIDYNVQKNQQYYITGDKDKLRQVFINIISNSIKFSKDSGKINVNMYPKDQKIIVEIKDNGIGIKEEDQPFIFERLYRGDKSRNEIDGSGIGLTIVKNILDLHLADIEVESKEKMGTKFTIYFDKVIV